MLTIRSFFTPPVSSVEYRNDPLLEGEVLVKTNDGKIEIHKIDHLKKLDFFKTLFSNSWKESQNNRIEIASSSEELHYVISLLLDRKPFFEVIPEESLTATTYEEFAELLNFYHPNPETFKVLEEIQHDLAFISLATAREIAGNSSYPELEKAPFCFRKAYEVILTSKRLSESEAEQYFIERRDFELERVKLIPFIQKLYTQEKNPHLNFQKKLLLKNQQACKKQLSRLDDKIKSLKALKCLSKFKNDPDPILRSEAQKPEIQASILIQKRKKLLEKSGANMQNDKVLHCIFGEPFILDHYLDLDFYEAPPVAEFPFFLKGAEKRSFFGFHLYNESPESFEQEIRSVLSCIKGITLPPPLLCQTDLIPEADIRNKLARMYPGLHHHGNDHRNFELEFSILLKFVIKLNRLDSVINSCNLRIKMYDYSSIKGKIIKSQNRHDHFKIDVLTWKFLIESDHDQNSSDEEEFNLFSGSSDEYDYDDSE